MHLLKIKKAASPPSLLPVSHLSQFACKNNKTEYRKVNGFRKVLRGQCQALISVAKIQKGSELVLKAGEWEHLPSPVSPALKPLLSAQRGHSLALPSPLCAT